MEKLVVNLSDIDLTKDQISLLSRGLKFCPTPGTLNPSDCRLDLDNLHRNLRLKFNFSDEEDSDPLNIPDTPDYLEPFKHRAFKIKSTYNPRGPSALEAMILSNELDFNRRPIASNKGTKNLSPGEFNAISELLSLNDRIIIKQADKGASVVVLNKHDYILEAEKQLSNTSFYLPMEENLTDKHNKEILAFIDQMFTNGELDISVVNYLHETEKKTSKFYLLPKIHKGITPHPSRQTNSGSHRLPN